MIGAKAAPQLFALPPGVAFPREFVAGFVRRYGHLPPEAQARITIHVNSPRMLRAIRSAFGERGNRLLPRLLLVSDIGLLPVSGLPPPVPGLRRRLQLAQLVGARLAQTGQAASGTAIFDLADSLARLLAEMQDEGLAPDCLDDPDLAGDHAEHWEQSLGFLRIVTGWLSRDQDIDAEGRQRLAVDALIGRWAAKSPDDPVLVAGSTGSRGTTRALMDAVAALPNGAVVVPGFDVDMPEIAWNRLCSGDIRHEDHPQFRLARLFAGLGMAASAVRLWSDASPPCPARNRLVSLALRPAPMTDQWITEGAGLTGLDAATAELSLIEAPSQRAEALAIAAALREAVANGQRAALITPDRTLTRRVAAALDRWGIVPDDSGGEPLSQTPPGRLLLQIAGLLGTRLTAGPLLAVLKHPLAATGSKGQGRGAHLLHTRDLEFRLRRSGPAFPTARDLIVWAENSGDPARIGWTRWLAPVLDATGQRGDLPLSVWVELLTGLAGTLAAGPGADGSGSLWDRSAGRSLRGAMGVLAQEAVHGGVCSAHVFQDLLRGHLASDARREADRPHPLVAIWGTLEARVQGADLVILGSLNEGAWPEAPAPDPWLSRQMRQRVGLLSPDRKIGLSAHDFQQAVGARTVILSRSLRDADSETVASRWLARLTNLLEGLPGAGGTEALADMRKRGRRLLALSRSAEAPGTKGTPERRPAPRPPAAFRPQRLSVTQVERLISDPYAIYARHVLRLRPLQSLVPEADPRLRGEVLHRLVEDFIRKRPVTETADEAMLRFCAETDTVLHETVPWPMARRLWRARILRASRRFLSAEAERAERGTPVLIEEEGVIEVDGLGFTLSARPDRVDLMDDGTVEIFDYKSGTLPKAADLRRHRVQLVLEAAMAERGAFATLGRPRVSRATYLQIGGDGDTRVVELTNGQADAAWDGLIRLIRHYQAPQSAFTARMMNLNPAGFDDYDGVSRYGEWGLHDTPAPVDLT